MAKLIILVLSSLFIISCTSSAKITDSQKEKYNKIDNYIEEINLDLPWDDGDDWVLVSVSREADTVLYFLRESNSMKSEFNYQDQKDYLIEFIQNEPSLVNDQMNFRMIYRFKDNKAEIIDITPEDYNM